MRTKNFLTMAALAGAITLTGCTNTDEMTTENPNFPADGVMRFASSVENPTTRAGYGNETDEANGTTNITAQDLSLWVTPQGEASSDYIHKSIVLHYTEAGGWGTYTREDVAEPVYTPLTLLWKNKTTKVNVVASTFGGNIFERIDLPASTNLVVNVQQLTSEAINFCDKLYFKGTIDPAATSDVTADGTTTYALDANGKIRLPLKHICSKLNITLTLGNEFSMDGAPGTKTDNPITAMTIEKMYNTDNFNMITGAFFGEYKNSSNNAATTMDFNPLRTGWTPATSATTNATATYECILIPQTVATGNFIVSFKIGDKTYRWTATADVTLESGKQYALNLTAGKDVVQTVGFTAKAWGTGETGSGLETE